MIALLERGVGLCAGLSAWLLPLGLRVLAVLLREVRHVTILRGTDEVRRPQGFTDFPELSVG